MTCTTNTSTCVSRLVISLLLLIAAMPAVRAQGQQPAERDSIPLLRGFALSFDLVGVAKQLIGTYGEYEGALRVNLRDRWFPIVEIGVGRANHERDEATGLTYKTTAPYFRVGLDWNIMKNKHADNRIYAGFRYAFTNYKADIIREDLPDPWWQSKTGFGMEGISCNMHWLEAVFAIDAKIYGPFHLGWSVRYKRRLTHKEGDIGKSWYTPGFGLNDQDNFTGTFNVIFDI